MANMYRRGTVWWARAQVAGVDRRVSLKTCHEAIAKARLREWLEQLEHPRYMQTVKGSLGGMPANVNRPDGSIYAIGYGDKVKIGWTSGPARQRLYALQIGCPEDLTLFARCVGSRAEERRLHREFAEQRIRGEWFWLRGPVLDWVNELRAKRQAARNAKQFAAPALQAMGA